MSPSHLIFTACMKQTKHLIDSGRVELHGRGSFECDKPGGAADVRDRASARVRDRAADLGTLQKIHGLNQTSSSPEALSAQENEASGAVKGTNAAP